MAMTLQVADAGQLERALLMLNEMKGVVSARRA
jgi:hypothetical protein